jgi:hypothetical protein
LNVATGVGNEGDVHSAPRAAGVGFGIHSAFARGLRYRHTAARLRGNCWVIRGSRRVHEGFLVVRTLSGIGRVQWARWTPEVPPLRGN